MNNKTLFFQVLLASAMSLTCCKQANDQNPVLIGKWQGTDWLIFDQPSGMDAAQVFFEFRTDGSYSADFASQHQQGSWRTEKDKLYTTEAGKKEIMVKLLKTDAASLEFEMNRGGQKETLKLKKVNN